MEVQTAKGGETDMTNVEIVADFASKGKKYCDDCLSETLNIRQRQQVNIIVRKLEKENNYKRGIRQCESCSKDKKVLAKF